MSETHQSGDRTAFAGLAAIAAKARRLYAARVANTALAPAWWTAVILTASSRRQAERYEWEIQRRQEGGKIPSGAQYLVAPDLDDQRIGSGGATLNGLRVLMSETLLKNGAAADLAEWWESQRVLMIHAGGDSRRLPQYSLSGKLFSAVPVATPWGETSTVFDEMMALSTAWVERLPSRPGGGLGRRDSDVRRGGSGLDAAGRERGGDAAAGGDRHTARRVRDRRFGAHLLFPAEAFAGAIERVGRTAEGRPGGAGYGAAEVRSGGGGASDGTGGGDGGRRRGAPRPWDH